MRVISFGGLALQKVAIGRQFAITLKVAIATVFIAYVSAIQITILERSVEGSNIKNFGDGLWWAVTTVTTVGYGDRYPTTTEGRFLAVLLMMMGISLVGVITASVASWFVKMSQDEPPIK
jgi:voltage-gated potassium channel